MVKRLDRCEEVIKDGEEVIKKQQELMKLYERQSDTYRDGLNAAINRAEAERARADAWYREPLIIIPSGILIGIILRSVFVK